MVTSKDGTRIAVDVVGTGPAVVCVGGALNDRHTAPALPGFTVYAYDRRGRGDSGDTQPYAVDRETEDLAAVLEATGGAAMVYGMSSGAVLALRAAVAGVPITRLALYEPPLNAPPGPPDYAARLASATPREALELFLTEVMRMPPAAVAGALRSPALVALAATLRYDDQVMAFGIPEVAGLPVPTTVLAGAESPEWMRTAARTLATALPIATVRELPGQGHAVDPAVLAAALTEAFA